MHHFAEGAVQELETAMKGTRNKDAYRRLLAVWLRAAFGLRGPMIARIVGWTEAHVYALQLSYLHRGLKGVTGPGRGGRRRSLLGDAGEMKLLRRLRHEAWPRSDLDFRTVQRAVEAEVGRPVAPSVVHRMLARHGWARRAMVCIPRQNVPPPGLDYPFVADVEPKLTGVWYMPAGESEDEWKMFLDSKLGAARVHPAQ